MAFRFVAANTHPDHDTLATFRRRFLKEIEVLFVQVLVLAREMNLLKLGAIALDGTKIKANATNEAQGPVVGARQQDRAQLRRKCSNCWPWPRAAMRRPHSTGWTCPQRSPGARC